MTEYIHIGRNVRFIRLLRRINQDKFAQLLHLTQQKVSKLENRKTLPPDLLQDIARVLRVTTETIIHFDQDAALNAGLVTKQPHIDKSVKEMIQYFNEEVAKRDLLIKQLEQVAGIHK